MNRAQEISKGLKWQFRLSEDSQTRMRFILPRLSLFFIAFLSFSIGTVLLVAPDWFVEQSRYMALFAGCLCIFLGLSLFYFTMTRKGEVVIDSMSRTVEVKFSSPKVDIERLINFSDFNSIETCQVKDMHGLHNHWRIELVGQDKVRIKLGAGFNGTFRKKVRDSLVNKMSEMMGVPVDYLD